MSYIPKSKAKSSIATEFDNFIILQTLSPYVGPYVELSNGRIYAGSNTDLLYEIEKSRKKPNPSLNQHLSCRIYGVLKSDIKSFLNKVNTIISTKNIPTEKDYEYGYYRRFFAKRKNSPQNFIEINPLTYLDLSQKTSKYDHNLYDAGVIVWTITGNVFKSNTLSIKAKTQKYPYIENFFSLINEFHRPDEHTQENLHTGGGELYYQNGKGYVGSYHIHPTKGPMEGPKHTESFHFPLYYIDTLPILTNNIADPYKDFLATQVETQGGGG